MYWYHLAILLSSFYASYMSVLYYKYAVCMYLSCIFTFLSFFPSNYKVLLEKDPFIKLSHHLNDAKC